MTAGEPEKAITPAVDPRWEWRAWGGLDNTGDTLAPLRAGEVHTSDETYVLSLHGDASVKVRDGLLDVKTLQHVDGTGLQQWVPVLKAAFPVDADVLTTMFTALGAPHSEPTRARYTREQLEREIIVPRDDLLLVAVHKVRRRSTLGGCMVEITDLTVDGTTTTSVAAESTDPRLVRETVGRLGLADRRNTSVPRGLKSVLRWGPARAAVIDVGTNSVKLHPAEARGGVLHALGDRVVVTRLGEGMTETGELSPSAMSRTADVVAEMVDEAREAGPADIVCVGTAALRQAPNRDAFVDDVFARTGVTVEVISGREEARLAYLAAVSALPPTDQRLLVFDSGGGSSQFTFGTRSRPEEQFSLDVGAVRVTERYGLAGVVSRATVDEALAGIADDLAPLGDHQQPDAVVAIGGTSTNLAAVRHGLADYDPEVVQGTVLDLAEVDRQIERYRQLDAEGRRGIDGLQPARAEVILGGACIVRTILTLTGQRAATVSDRGLRHGVLAERFGPQEASSIDAK